VQRLQLFVLISFALLSSQAMALPIDWNGTFGVDSTLIDSFRKLDRVNEGTLSTGSQETPLAAGNHANASWQSYVFRLAPNLIVNDSSTIKGELTSGYGRGGRFGDSSQSSKKSGYGNAIYNQNGTSGDDLQINKLYVELYSDTATYLVGRHSFNWGLGAVINSGDNAWDRHLYTRDGLTMDIKIGSFQIAPFMSKVSSDNSLTRATNSKEYGFSMLYDNPDKDMAMGLLYSKKKNNKSNTSSTTEISGSSQALGEAEVKLIDIYFKKSFGDFNFAVEVPVLSGELGNVYSATSKSKYKAKAIILESNYKINDTWSVSLFGGKVNGDSGGQSSFDAMYLNPNYQVAQLLFRYNLRGITDPNTYSVYDSYITNTTYLKLNGAYNSDKWTWDTALIWAKADQTAIAGQKAFNHELNRQFDAVASQSDDLGMEIDTSLDYQWNNEVNIGASFAYLFAGDYWGFTNIDGQENAVGNSFLMQVKTSVSF
jgi:hypothetical protein